MLKKLNTWKRNDKKIDEARKKLNDSVGLGRRDSIEYLAPGESGRAEDEAGVDGPGERSEVVVKVQANNLGLGLILELAPHDGNVVIDIWEQGGISEFRYDIRPGDILAKVRRFAPRGPVPPGESLWASGFGTYDGWIDCRHEELSKVLRDNHLGGQQLMEFGILRLGESAKRARERADTSQAATSGAL